MIRHGLTLIALLLVSASALRAQDKPPRAIERKTRGAIDNYLRHRTNCLSRCEAGGGCGMKGSVVKQFDRGRRGIDFIFVPHKTCMGTGRRFNKKTTGYLLDAHAPDSISRPFESVDEVRRIHAAAHRTLRHWNTKNDKALTAEVHALWTRGALVDLKNRLKLIERPSAVRIARPRGITYSRSEEGAWFVDVRLTDGEFVLFALRPRDPLLDVAGVEKKSELKRLRGWEWLILDDSERSRWAERFAGLRASVEERVSQTRRRVENEAARRVEVAWSRLVAMRTGEPVPEEFDEAAYAQLLSECEREVRWFDTPELAAITLVEEVRDEIRFRMKEQECVDPLTHPEQQLGEYMKLVEGKRFTGKAGEPLLERAVERCRERLAVIEQVRRDASAVTAQVDDAACGLLREILGGFVHREPFSLDLDVVEKAGEAVEKTFRRLIELGERGSSDEDRAAALLSVGKFSETAAFTSEARHVRAETRDRLALVRQGALAAAEFRPDTRPLVLALVARNQLDAAAGAAETDALRAFVDLRSGAREAARKRLVRSLGKPETWPAESSWLEHLDALAAMWEVELRSNRGEHAAVYLKRIDDLAPTWPAVQLRVAETLAGIGQHEEARRRLENMTSSYEGVTAAHLLDVQILLARGEIPAAVSALRDHGSLPGGDLWRAVAAARRGDVPGALVHIRKHVNAFPSDPLGHANAAVIHVLNDDVAAARASCDRALELDARCYLARLQRAEISEPAAAGGDMDVAQSVMESGIAPIAIRASLLPARHGSALYGNDLVAVVHVVRAAVYFLVARQPKKGFAALGQAVLSTDAGSRFVVGMIDALRDQFEPGSAMAQLAEEVRAQFAR